MKSPSEASLTIHNLPEQEATITAAHTLKAARTIAKKLLILCYVVFILVICADVAYRTSNLAQSGQLFARPQTATGETHVSDFVLLYADGMLNLDRITGRLEADTDIYDPFLSTQMVERLVAPWHPAEIYSIQYAPVFFLYATPLACLNLQDARTAWAITIYACVIASFLILSAGAIKSKFERVIGSLICLANMPLLNLLYGGQTSAFELLFVSLAFVFLKSKKYFWAGFLGGATVLKIHFCPIVLIPGLVLGRAKFLYGFLAMAVLEGLLSTIVVGPNNLFNFFRTNYLCEIAHVYSGHNNPQNMSNIRGVLSMLFPNSAAVTPAVFALYFLACALTILLWVKVYPALQARGDRAFYLATAVSLSLLLVFCPHTYSYDYILMIIPCTWLYAWCLADEGDARDNQSAEAKIFHWVTRSIIISAPFVSLIFLIPLDFVAALIVQRIALTAYLIDVLGLAALAIFVEQRHIKAVSGAGQSHVQT